MEHVIFRHLVSVAFGLGTLALPNSLAAQVQSEDFAFPALAAGQVPCADKSVGAVAVRTLDDVRAFVRCAVEYVAENGAEEAYRAFSEDERWRSGPLYVFVTNIPAPGERPLTFLHAANPALEGTRRGPLVDNFGNEFFSEQTRLANGFGGGWIFYSRTNPETGIDEPKASYVQSIDWGGTPAVLGAGVYPRDLPAACAPEYLGSADPSEMHVSAAGLAANRTPEYLQDFVRCAAYVVETKGYFAKGELASGERWRFGSIYLFGLDGEGVQFFTGNPARVNGMDRPEWGDATDPAGPFGGRDVVSVAKAFGETFLYYDSFNPECGRVERKVAFVKRVTAQGDDVLIGAGYYPLPSPLF